LQSKITLVMKPWSEELIREHLMYDGMGRPTARRHYNKRAVQHGDWLQYYRNGFAKVSGQYRNGEITGDWFLYASTHGGVVDSIVNASPKDKTRIEGWHRIQGLIDSTVFERCVPVRIDQRLGGTMEHLPNWNCPGD